MATAELSGAVPPTTRRGGAATRRRGAKLEAALLQAAWDELTAVGYAALTMEGVAARARTGRAVLYRRWPSRSELVLAASRRHAAIDSMAVPRRMTIRAFANASWTASSAAPRSPQMRLNAATSGPTVLLPEPMKPVRTMRRGATELEEVSTDLVYRRKTGWPLNTLLKSRDINLFR